MRVQGIAGALWPAWQRRPQKRRARPGDLLAAGWEKVHR
jgi:hypothetical protein